MACTRQVLIPRMGIVLIEPVSSLVVRSPQRRAIRSGGLVAVESQRSVWPSDRQNRAMSLARRYRER